MVAGMSFPSLGPANLRAPVLDRLELGRLAGQLRQGYASGPLELGDAVRAHEVGEGVELVGRPRHHEGQRVVADVEDLGLEDRRELGDLRTQLAAPFTVTS